LIEPLLTKNFLRYFNKLKNKNKTYLEIGSGDSTIYFSKHFKKVISLEDNKTFFNIISNNKPKNVDIKFFNRKNIGNLLKTELDKKPNYVMIDNNPCYISRFDIAKFIHFNKQNDCIILLDNGNWNMQTFMFLRTNYYCMDFPGLNKHNQNTVTSIFFTGKNSNYVYGK
tara:strand:- start:690 stop:1196 length:507 start_codon:yes stop_codon:yes gene_type:complete